MLIPVVLAAALMNAAMVAASAVSTILIADQLAPALAGLPNTAGVLGTAAGAVVVGRWSARLGRAQALRTGYGIAVAGGALTVLAAVGAPVALLFLGMFLLGTGNAASLLSRYAAAEAVSPARRAAAMSTVVWAGTAGAAGGPFLLEPAKSFAESAGLPALCGPFLLAVTTAFAALLAAGKIRPTPAHGAGTEPAPRSTGVEPSPRGTDTEPVSPSAAVETAPRSTAVEPAPRSTGIGAASRSTALVAAGVMLVGQLVMVALMTSVPVHAHHHGQGLGVLGLMLSAHTLGMFALAPVTGWWIDRAGPKPTILAGLATVTVSALVIAGPAGMAFTPGLFLLGYGWNLCYLGGSALLSSAAADSPAARAKLESKAEAWVWAVSALATAASTLLFAAGGFMLLSGVSIALAVPTLVAVLTYRPGSPRAVTSLAGCQQQKASVPCSPDLSGSTTRPGL
ncbi:MFS transporter [Kribbella voronezhensis]|uniref:MFS transporter n=1 Tax=Kribbella voronezhensis TaxID=2512212 RepID=A0A4R7TEK6_9ACTN|nr:MFS transporter [Kribbella voronezhensis]TDU89956.1 MFS transporter [Kribbella voronezhensis]